MFYHVISLGAMPGLRLLDVSHAGFQHVEPPLEHAVSSQRGDLRSGSKRGSSKPWDLWALVTKPNISMCRLNVRIQIYFCPKSRSSLSFYSLHDRSARVQNERVYTTLEIILDCTIYTILYHTGVLGSRIGGSTCWILMGVWVMVMTYCPHL